MRSLDSRAWVLAAVGALGFACANPAPVPAPAPYVFAWPFVTGSMEPRGGTTRGADVTLATSASDAWTRLQAPELHGRERDRAAILALAGDYRASFDFIETVLFEPGAQPARPYRSWGTERVYVIEDRGDRIRLQHILVMFAVDDTGQRQGPFVQKHWRQDWRYEPKDLLVFRGDRRFETKPLRGDPRRGSWSQTVYDVDDTPRYASLGRWTHGREASTWEGSEAWRPLPRREYSVRSDYQVLAGRNRITVLPRGWVHEQDNQKLVLAAGGSRALARELGVDRYERVVDFDFASSDAYWSATGPFWAWVRRGWDERLARQRRFEVAATCGGEEPFVPFFRYADRLAGGEAIPAESQRAEAERILDCLVSRDGRSPQ